MLRSSSDQDVAEPVYNLKAILAGRFDADLRTWCDGARDFGSPLLVEWGTEANGEWFSWNGNWNGGATSNGYGDRHRADGPERFVDVFRHLVTTCRERGADNVRWAWHVDAESWPKDEWNDLEAYWPGSDVVDVIAVSAYGAQQPTDTDSSSLRSLLDPVYPRLTALARAGGEPVVLAEFGVTDHNPHVDQAEWARQALTDLTGGRWPGLAGFSWWNEQWENDDNNAHDTTMRVQDNPKLAAVFTELVGRNDAGARATAGRGAALALLGAGDPVGGLHQGEVRQGLRGVAGVVVRGQVVLLGQQADVVGQPDEAVHQQSRASARRPERAYCSTSQNEQARNGCSPGGRSSMCSDSSKR